MNRKQYSFTEMSRKTVINVADGRELGHVCDMIFNNCGGVLGFVVPGKKSFFKSITSSDNIFIPWNRIIKIGSDVVLVELVGNNARTCVMSENEAQTYSSTQPQQNEYSAPDDYEQQRYTSPQNAYSQAESSAQTVYHDGNHTV